MSEVNVTAVRVMVVEDDALLAFDAATHLERAGFTVVGPAMSLAKALALLAETQCDAAVLDVHLGQGETSEPVARQLVARGIPFLTVTGYSHEQRPAAYNGAQMLTKPVRPTNLIAAVRKCLDGG